MSKEIKAYTPLQEWFGSQLIKGYGRYQVWMYELSGGRLANLFLGAPCAILTTTGRKSGKKRKTPLLFVEEEQRVIIAGTKGGMSVAPLWYRNIEADPHVDFQIGDRKRAMVARKASPEEAAQLWPKLDAIYAGFQEYRTRLKGVREAPVLILQER